MLSRCLYVYDGIYSQAGNKHRNNRVNQGYITSTVTRKELDAVTM
jgi:hypothetical protein